MKKIKITPDGIVEENLTADEIAQAEANDVKAQEAIQAEETAKTQKATDQASGNQKLLDLGLSQAEATALTGYTPPSEV
jgi:hydroxylamine reductase (hybrid-cluster protein)